LQLLRFQNRLKSVCRNADDLRAVIFLELLTDKAPPFVKIVYHESMDKGLIADGLLVLAVRGQIDGLIASN
jgi:hypothetical protein